MSFCSPKCGLHFKTNAEPVNFFFVARGPGDCCGGGKSPGGQRGKEQNFIFHWPAEITLSISEKVQIVPPAALKTPPGAFENFCLKKHVSANISATRGSRIKNQDTGRFY